MGQFKISIPFFSSLNNLLKGAYIIFQKGVNKFEIQYKKKDNFWLGVQFPLKRPG